MKNIVLAAALALIAVPALAVGPESFTVDVSRGYAVQQPSSPSADQGRSNWAPRGQQASEQASSESATAPAPRTVKASGKPHRTHKAAKAPSSAAPVAPKAAPAK